MAQLALLLLLALSQACAYHILVVFPVPGKSHNILGQGYVKNLLEAGHEVTYVTPFPTHKTTAKYHEVDISKSVEKFDQDKFSLKKLLDGEVSFDFTGFLPKLVEMMRTSLENENLLKVLNDTTQHFDAVIVEWLYSDAYAGFGAVFDCPLIWSSSLEPHWLILRLIHESSNPAFNPDALSTATPPFSFVERLKSLFSQVFIKAAKIFYLDAKEKELYEEIFGPAVAKRGRVLPPYGEAIFNGSFMLTNSHSSLSQPISVPPNSKEIGGYHIDPNVKPLPADLQKLMDEAKHGVIYFSMGSNAKSKDFPDSLKQDFLKVLGGVKQTVIWKFEEDLPNRPKNVHIVQWAPQPSILAHPNCRLFITHGGLLSTTEAIYFGVPTIVMPYGADQHLNAIRAVQKGYARKVQLSYEMAGEMKLAIDEIIGNPKYMDRVKELSKIYHDRLVPPGKELVHWVEHVVRTGGAPHLRSPALMLPWYQKMYLDLFVVVLVVIYTLKLIIKKLFSLVKSLFKKNVTANKRKKN
ncbi:UDP-glucosyltransferase 2-like [Choristoneura fumiferana]|uniref:UDP-glucosyltransferase 2-like n=1 Tax=Choristoneura fumiferana TaxID=7141 RepID=UPI003D154983